jgi:hypothetical protein
METVFLCGSCRYVINIVSRVPELKWELSTVRLSDLTSSSWIVSERVQWKGHFSLKTVCEEKTRGLVRNGRYPRTKLVSS